MTKQTLKLEQQVSRVRYLRNRYEDVCILLRNILEDIAPCDLSGYDETLDVWIRDGYSQIENLVSFLERRRQRGEALDAW